MRAWHGLCLVGIVLWYMMLFGFFCDAFFFFKAKGGEMRYRGIGKLTPEND